MFGDPAETPSARAIITIIVSAPNDRRALPCLVAEHIPTTRTGEEEMSMRRRATAA